jgi:DNA-binding transcriptional ArsR family regulator
LIAGQCPPGTIRTVNDVPKRNGAGIELLADPTRRRIIAALALGPRRPSVLALEIGLSRPATARQLHLLRDAGLVRSTRSCADGRVFLFRIEPLQLGRITAWLAGTEIARPTTGAGFGAAFAKSRASPADDLPRRPGRLIDPTRSSR